MLRCPNFNVLVLFLILYRYINPIVYDLFSMLHSSDIGFLKKFSMKKARKNLKFKLV